MYMRLRIAPDLRSECCSPTNQRSARRYPVLLAQAISLIRQMKRHRRWPVSAKDCRSRGCLRGFRAVPSASRQKPLRSLQSRNLGRFVPVAHVAGKDWLGSLPEPGPAFYIGAEDDKTEIHIRLAAIAKHCGVKFADLIQKGLKVLPLLGQDATLCASGKSGRVETTALYKQLYEQAGDFKPKNISIDTLSRAFAGSEIDRVQVYPFAQHMQALAMVAGGSVTILSHPSLNGINSGSGISGSTAWHGAFRFRQYLTSTKPDAGEQPDNDLRQLEFKKNQYGPIGETIVLRYQNGLFLPVAGMSGLERSQPNRGQMTCSSICCGGSNGKRSVTDKWSKAYARLRPGTGSQSG